MGRKRAVFLAPRHAALDFGTTFDATGRFCINNGPKTRVVTLASAQTLPAREALVEPASGTVFSTTINLSANWHGHAAVS